MMKAKNKFLKKLGAVALAAGVAVGTLAVGALPVSAASGFQVTEGNYEKAYTLEDGTVYYELSYAYPVIEGDSAAAEKINAQLEAQRDAWIKQAEAAEAEYKSVYEEYVSLAGEAGVAWKNADKVTYEVTTNDGKYFSVLMSGYAYTGGAHGAPYRITMTFDAQTGEKLTAAKVLGTTKAKVNKKVKKHYLNKYDKKGIDAGFYGEGASGREQLQAVLADMNFNNAFYVKNGKVVFYAEPYVLGPYAAGYIEVSLSLK